MSWLDEEAGVEIMHIVESFCLVTRRLCRALLETERDLDPYGACIPQEPQRDRGIVGAGILN